MGVRFSPGAPSRVSLEEKISASDAEDRGFESRTWHADWTHAAQAEEVPGTRITAVW